MEFNTKLSKLIARRNFVTINIDFISNMKYFDKGANTIFIHICKKGCYVIK